METVDKISQGLRFKDDAEKIEFLNDAIQLDILHSFMDSKGIKQSEIAQKMHVSDSFVSQLFSGDKHLSLYHLASLIYYFDLDFKIELKPKQKLEPKEEARIVKFTDYMKKDKNDYCLAGKNATKYHAQESLEEDGPQTCCI